MLMICTLPEYSDVIQDFFVHEGQARSYNTVIKVIFLINIITSGFYKKYLMKSLAVEYHEVVRTMCSSLGLKILKIGCETLKSVKKLSRQNSDKN